MHSRLISLLAVALAVLTTPQTSAQEPSRDVAAMKPFTVVIDGTKVDIPMIPLRVGTDGFPATVKLGSAESEPGRNPDEGPRLEVAVEPFWIGKYEITWDTYDEFRREYGARSRDGLRHDSADANAWADAVSLPTPLYEQDAAPILAGMGTTGGYPVANITHYAARQFTKWLSVRTGRYFRLPTEAEWEYAARGGTNTAFSFGDDPEKLGDHAWFFDNSAYEDTDRGHPDFGSGYRKVGQKLPNPFGLFDMHGNVAEWVLDQYRVDAYSGFEDARTTWSRALRWPTTVFPCVARGGSWDSDAAACRSAARLASRAEWQKRDPQLPRSIWWFTDGFHVGFRIVAPLNEPSREEKLRSWETVDEQTLAIIQGGGKEVRAALGVPESASQPDKGESKESGKEER